MLQQTLQHLAFNLVCGIVWRPILGCERGPVLVERLNTQVHVDQLVRRVHDLHLALYRISHLIFRASIALEMDVIGQILIAPEWIIGVGQCSGEEDRSKVLQIFPGCEVIVLPQLHTELLLIDLLGPATAEAPEVAALIISGDCWFPVSVENFHFGKVWLYLLSKSLLQVMSPYWQLPRVDVDNTFREAKRASTDSSRVDWSTIS